MPELPDVTVYVEALDRLATGHRLERIRLANPFLLRTVEPPMDAYLGRTLQGVARIGKRIALTFDDDHHLVLHLMIAGRLHWRPKGANPPGRRGLAAFDFDHATLTLTEAGSKRRASLHAARGPDALTAFDPGGIEPLTTTPAAFRAALTRENHTLKRALTDPTLLSGVGNAYSDEILHHAQLSPFLQTHKLDDDQWRRLHESTRHVLTGWTQRLRDEAGDAFPEKVTAFRDGMSVHGRHGRPCPRCGDPVQRIRYADNETNYCATCQTGGRLLADRALSRLLRDDWPRTVDALERRPRPP